MVLGCFRSQHKSAFRMCLWSHVCVLRLNGIRSCECTFQSMYSYYADFVVFRLLYYGETILCWCTRLLLRLANIKMATRDKADTHAWCGVTFSVQIHQFWAALPSTAYSILCGYGRPNRKCPKKTKRDSINHHSFTLDFRLLFDNECGCVLCCWRPLDVSFNVKWNRWL